MYNLFTFYEVNKQGNLWGAWTGKLWPGFYKHGNCCKSQFSKNVSVISTPTVICTEDKIMTHFGQSLVCTIQEWRAQDAFWQAHPMGIDVHTVPQWRFSWKCESNLHIPTPSACQTLALQWLCYQALHSRRHVKRQTNSNSFVFTKNQAIVSHSL